MKLRRVISLRQVIFYGVGVIIGAGIYSIIGPAAGITGNSLWISFLVAAITALFTGLCYCEISTMFPKAAAEYVYVRKAFGSRFFAFLIGWLVIITGVLSAATVSLGFAGYFKSLFGFSLIPIALVLIAALSFINFKGMKESSRFNTFLVFVTIIGLLAVIFTGAPSFGKVNYLEFPSGYKGVFSAAILIFFAYIGFEDIANVAEETKNPRKVLPRAIIFSVLITTVFYILTSISAVSLADYKELAASDAPLSLAVSKVFGQRAFIFISATALFTTAGTVLIILVVTSRMLYGMAKERSLPKFLTSLHQNNRTPWLAVLTTAFFSMIFVFLGDIRSVAELTSLAALVTFTTVNISLIWLRYTMPNVKRTFRTPLNIGKYPIMAFLGIFSTLFMIFQFNLNMLFVGLGILLSGLIAYSFFVKEIKE